MHSLTDYELNLFVYFYVYAVIVNLLCSSILVIKPFLSHHTLYFVLLSFHLALKKVPLVRTPVRRFGWVNAPLSTDYTYEEKDGELAIELIILISVYIHLPYKSSLKNCFHFPNVIISIL
jgi:hypothetical protein